VLQNNVLLSVAGEGNEGSRQVLGVVRAAFTVIPAIHLIVCLFGLTTFLFRVFSLLYPVLPLYFLGDLVDYPLLSLLDPLELPVLPQSKGPVVMELIVTLPVKDPIPESLQICLFSL
jgi:hypothetical protein